MISRRDFLLLGGAFALTACSNRLAGVEDQPTSKLATVTLAISGMT